MKNSNIVSDNLKEQRNANGLFTRPLYIKHLELEYWCYLKEIKQQNPDIKSIADLIRFMAKRCTGRI